MSSRRERRRKQAAKGKGKWVIRGAVTLFVGAVAVLGGGYLWLGHWLHGEGLRKMMADAAGEATRTRAEFGVFDWSGTLLQTPSFAAEGDSLVKRVDAKGMKVDIGIAAAWHGVLKLDEARVRSIEVELDSSAPDEKPVSGKLPDTSAAAEPRKKAAKWYDRFVPHELDLQMVQIDSSSLKVRTRSGTLAASGTAWKVNPDQAKGSYLAQANGGKLTLPWKWAPPMQLGMAKLRYADDTVFLNDADFQVYQSGSLNLTGEMSLKGNGYKFDGDLSNVKCSEILEGDWKKRLEGNFRTSFNLANPTGEPEVHGNLILSDAVLTALPLLDTLSAYADTTRFRRMALQEASCVYTWKHDGSLQLRNIVLSSEGLVRVEGFLNVAPDKRIDGVLRLGLIPGVLAQIPGAETDVFTRGERQLLWTSVRISGTLDRPEEDLTDRLVRAAGERMFEVLPETGEKVLKFSHRVLGKELPDAVLKGAEVLGPQVIDQGREILGTGSQVIDQGKEILNDAKGVAKDAGDIFDLLRGKEPKRPVQPPPPPAEPDEKKDGDR